MDDIDAYLSGNAQQFENDLCALLKIPSVSADASRKGEVRRAGDWVAAQFRGLALKTEIIETAGHPLVYAESPPVAGKPVVLVYGHYDVQPAEPLNEWISPPFEPTPRNGNLYARGATDDKGQMLTHVFSTIAWLKTRGKLPLQLKFLIEGEEEVGSGNLFAYLAKPDAQKKLACDIAVISDTSQFGPGQPAITYGLRGGVWFELIARGPRQDLHSGTFGGAVANPINALCRLLALLIDERGRVQLPGFYDEVVPLSEEERKRFAALPFSDAKFKQQIGVQDLPGEEGFTTLERRWARPTYDILRIAGGPPIAKAAISSRAEAKASFRLVPNQDPKKIAAALKEFLLARRPPGIELEVNPVAAARGVVVPIDSPYIAAASRAIERAFGKAPVFIREGGSIPIVNAFKDQLRVDTLLLGWGLDDDNTHGPNEKFCLADFHRGIKASAHLWNELGDLKH
jgi:succinyl-diaminopimelate desuccinylase